MQEGGIRRPALEIQVQHLVQCNAVAFGERLQTRELLQSLRIPRTATNSRNHCG